jgi:hypothetical protein
MKDDQSQSSRKLPIDFDALSSIQSSAAIAVIGISLSVLLLLIAALAIGWILVDLIGGDQKRAAEATKAALPLLAATVGLPLLIWRLKILDRQTRISEEKTQIDRQTHYTSIFSRSVEQLGQTREVKTSRHTDGKDETITRTVPNIEVRLGGIHSLARLAEESSRDLEKIENTLLSYVRENSWSDRDGIATTPLKRRAFRTWGWQYPFYKGAITPEADEKLAEWKKKIEQSTKQRLAWAGALKETRVDVNEAVEAIPKLGGGLSKSEHIRHYECLFVGPHFKQRALIITSFERCIFVGCSFDFLSEHRFLDCQFIRCSLRKLDNTTVRITRSTFDNFSIHEMTSSSLSLVSCDIANLSLYKSIDSLFRVAHSSAYELRITSDTPIKLDFSYSAVDTGYIGAVDVDASSSFDNCALSSFHFEGTNMSAVTKISAPTFERTTSNPAAKQPQELARPQSWSAFDPDYVEEDFPF